MRKSTMIMGECKAVTNEPSETIQVNNCKGGYFSVLDDFGLKVCGKTEQGGLSGKNLINILRSPNVVNDCPNMTYDIDGNTITINSPNAYDGKIRWYIDNIIPNGSTITVSLEKTDECIGILYYNTETKQRGSALCEFSKSSTPKSVTRTINYPSGYDSILVTLHTRYSQTGNVISISNFQIEISPVATEYEPYCGGIPAPNPEYPIPIQCVKQGTKITCDTINDNISDRIIGYELNSDAGYVTTALSWWVSPYIKLNGSKTLKISGKTSGGANCFYDRNKTFIITIRATTGTITVPQNAEYVRYNGVVTQMNTTRMISNFGSEITTPCDLYEGDIWYPMTGKVVSDNGIIQSYNGESVTTSYKSTTGGLTTGANIVYKLQTPVTEQYDPQPIFVPQGYMQIIQTPTDLSANLQATVLVKE